MTARRPTPKKVTAKAPGGRVRRTIGGHEYLISQSLNALTHREGLVFNPDTSLRDRSAPSRATPKAPNRRQR